MLDLAIRGTLVLPDQVVPGTLGIRDGRIVAIAEPGEALEARTTDDVGAALVLPGAIDAHCHTRSSPDEDIDVVTTFAAAGGVTTVCDMPYDDGTPVFDAATFARKRDDVERTARVDVALWASVAPGDGNSEISGLVDAGACAFKMSMFDTDARRFPQIRDGQLLDAMERLAGTGVPVGVHCENNDLIVTRLAQARAQGRTDNRAHGDSRPPVSEIEAVGRLVELATATGAQAYAVHLSTRAAVAKVATAPTVEAETCLHYLLLDEEEMVRRGPVLKINPPLRPAVEREGLWTLLADGTISTVSSDHVAWPLALKEKPVLEAKSGVPGVGVLLPLLFHEMVTVRGLPVRRLVDVLAAAPARIFGLADRKGRLAVGLDADVAVVEPDRTWAIDGAELAHPIGWSPYDGRTAAHVSRTYVRGRLAARDGVPTNEAIGRFQTRA